MKYIKSCLNYTGGKYRILKQLCPLFPQNITSFVDLFTGGANVALNIKAENIYCYDNNRPLIDLFNFIKNEAIGEIEKGIERLIDIYELSDSSKNGYGFYGCDSSIGLGKYNKLKYLKLREDFNQSNYDDFSKCLYFYTLIIFGFNNQIRFNKKGEFNIPVGKRDFNDRVRNNLRLFSKTIKNKDIKFECSDFRNVKIDKLDESSFLYADPPYLITLASYNEQDGWTEKDEMDLLYMLDWLDSQNIKFALSNVLENKGKINYLLIEWAKKYNINYINFNYNNSNYQIKNRKQKTVEVLITNYDMKERL